LVPFGVVLVRVLGEPGIVSGADVGVRLRPIERRLLAVLAVRCRAAVPVEMLVDALWPRVAPVAARKTMCSGRVGSSVPRRFSQLWTATVSATRWTRLGAVRAGDARGGSGCWTERVRLLRRCPERPLDDLRHWGPADARRAESAELRSSALEARWEATLRGDGLWDPGPVVAHNSSSTSRSTDVPVRRSSGVA
jgi:hypothetical protein